jgi:hypothetical protein
MLSTDPDPKPRSGQSLPADVAGSKPTGAAGMRTEIDLDPASKTAVVTGTLG